MRKSPSVAYYSYKINTTPKSVLIQELKDAPISENDLNFLIGIINKKSYKELAKEFNKSEARIYQWKRSLFEFLCLYDYEKENQTENSFPYASK